MHHRLPNHLSALRKARKDEGGFTLIELLIVIVILGVLAAIVVFSVRGITDRGEECRLQDRRSRRSETAVEALLRQGTAATRPPSPQLVAGGFLRVGRRRASARRRQRPRDATRGHGASPAAAALIGRTHAGRAAVLHGSPPRLSRGGHHAPPTAPHRQPRSTGCSRRCGTGRRHRPAADRRPAADAPGRRRADPGARAPPR